MLLNLQTRVIEADFHTFVRPTEIPQLSEFCTSYTGIKQEDVDNGVYLSDALRMFHEWIRSLRAKDLVLIDDSIRKQNTVLVTWTDFDLGIYLSKECERKSIRLPAYFNRWIDLRDYYSVSVNSKVQFVRPFLSFANSIINFLFRFWFRCLNSYGLESIESYHSRSHWRWWGYHLLEGRIQAQMIRGT